MSSDQLPPVDVSGCLTRELRRASTQSVVLSQVIAERLRINPTDLECLGLLAENGSVTAGRLAELTGLTTGAITGVIDRLERAGYARRERDPHDRRRVFVQPLMERIDQIGPHFAALAQTMDELVAQYTGQDLKLILDFVIRSNDLVQQHIARLQQEVVATGRTGPARKADRAGLTSG
jgi:DNA-binding MarR family transcriptional regulator